MAIDEGEAFLPVRIAVLTVSDSRTLADDRSGDTLVRRIEAAGHIVAERRIEKDDVPAIAAILLPHVQTTFAACLIFAQTVLVLGVVALLEQHPLPESQREPLPPA